MANTSIIAGPVIWSWEERFPQRPELCQVTRVHRTNHHGVYLRLQYTKDIRDARGTLHLFCQLAFRASGEGEQELCKGIAAAIAHKEIKYQTVSTMTRTLSSSVTRR